MLAIFDVEGILVDGELLPALAELAGCRERVEEITLQGIRGQIPWEEGLIERIRLVRGVKYTDAKRIADNLPLMKGSRELAKSLRDKGYKRVAVSGGFTLLADRIGRELQLDEVFANELIFKEGLLDDVKVRINSDKAAALKPLIQATRQKGGLVLVVADGANDLQLIKLADVSIAFNAQDIVKKSSKYVVNGKDLAKVGEIIESIEASRMRQNHA